MTARDELVVALAGRYALGSRADRGRMLEWPPFLSPPPQVPPREPANPEDREGQDGEVEAVHDDAQLRVAAPLLPKQVAHVGEGVALGPGACERVKLKRHLRHAGDPGR